jgi:hypothetical protein
VAQGSASTGDGSVLPLSDRKGRMGVMYVRALLAQAGLPNEETTSGEDHGAVDLRVNFRIGGVAVQVKCGALKPNQDGTYSVTTTEAWRKKWAVSSAPVYLVHVQLEASNVTQWIDHPQLHTRVRAHAYWARVNDCAKTVRLSPQNRLTSATFAIWLADLRQAFGVKAS